MAGQAGAHFTVAWEPRSRPQREFLKCPVEEVFFGGARGGGKPDAVLGEWAIHAGRYGDKAIGLIVRRTRPQLSEPFEHAKEIYLPLGAKATEAPIRMSCSAMGVTVHPAMSAMAQQVGRLRGAVARAVRVELFDHLADHGLSGQPSKYLLCSSVIHAWARSSSGPNTWSNLV